MLNVNNDLEKKLETIAARSGRTIDELANDVLSDYAREVDDLESLNLGDSDDMSVKAEEFVYVRRRDQRRAS